MTMKTFSIVFRKAASELKCVVVQSIHHIISLEIIFFNNIFQLFYFQVSSGQEKKTSWDVMKNPREGATIQKDGSVRRIF